MFSCPCLVCVPIPLHCIPLLSPRVFSHSQLSSDFLSGVSAGLFLAFNAPSFISFPFPSLLSFLPSLPPSFPPSLLFLFLPSPPSFLLPSFSSSPCFLFSVFLISVSHSSALRLDSSSTSCPQGPPPLPHPPAISS